MLAGVRTVVRVALEHDVYTLALPLLLLPGALTAFPSCVRTGAQADSTVGSGSGRGWVPSPTCSEAAPATDDIAPLLRRSELVLKTIKGAPAARTRS